MKEKINKDKPEQIIAKAIFTLAFLTFWITALYLPAYIPAHNSQNTAEYGYSCFILGALGLISSHTIYGVIWAANVIGVVSLIMLFLKAYSKASLWSLIAFLVSLGSIFIYKLPADESFDAYSNYTPGPAVFLWVASMFTIFVGTRVVQRMGQNATSSSSNKVAKLLRLF